MPKAENPRRHGGLNRPPGLAWLGRGVAYGLALALLAFVVSGWVGFWPGEAPVWSRARLPVAPSEGGPALWTLDAPTYPSDMHLLTFGFELGPWLVVLAGLALAVAATLVVERNAPRRCEALALVGALVTVAGVVFASRAAWHMMVWFPGGNEVPRALDAAVRLLLAGAALSAVGLVRVLLARERRDGATLALCAMITALAGAFYCERFLVRPVWATPPSPRTDFEPVRLTSVIDALEFDAGYGDREACDEVLELSATGEVSHVGPRPGHGPPERWPADELEARLRALAARMAEAPLSEGSHEFVPDGVLWLRLDARTPFEALHTLQAASMSVGIWKLGLFYRVTDSGPGARRMLFLPRQLDNSEAPDLTLRRGLDGGVEVTSGGAPIDWTTAGLSFQDIPVVFIAADVPAAALLDVLRRLGPEIVGPLQLASPR